jgi:hypothetical protein
MRTGTFGVALAAVAMLTTLAATPASAQYWSGLWKDPAVQNYELSMEKVRKVVDVLRAVATDAETSAKLDRDFKELVKANPKPTVAQVTALIDGEPVVRNAIGKTGLTTRDYLLSSTAVSNAGVHMMLRSRGQGETPPLTDAQKANVALLEKNSAEWQKLQQEMIRLGEQAIAKPKR